MKRFIRSAAALLAAGSLTATPAAAQREAPRAVLYRVAAPEGATVYMLGSIHLLTENVFPLAETVEEAYANAERVVFEVNIDSMQARATELAPRGIWRDGKTLRSEIPADLYAQLEKAVAQYASSGIGMRVLDRFEPWLVGMMLSQLEWARMGMQAQHGVDMHFEGRAQRDGKALGSLETVDFQIGLMDGFPIEEQVEMLRQTLEDLPRTTKIMEEMVQAWRDGDTDALDGLMNEGMGSPGVYARMLTDRNAAWVPQIEAYLRGREDVLLVVGAGHLVGDESVVAMLRERGYVVDQL